MKVVKFVAEDFTSLSLDYHENFDYSRFGIPIEIDTEPEEIETYPEGYGQRDKYIHVFPINEDIEFEDVYFTTAMILLEVAEEDIVYCEGNGKMLVRKATPIRQIVETDEEWEIIKTAACKKPEFAYWYARNIDRKPTEKTRTAACKDPHNAYLYALCVDKGPTEETRTAACQSPFFACMYANYVDKGPTEETRTAAYQDPKYASQYDRDVNKKPTVEAYSREPYEYWEMELDS